MFEMIFILKDCLSFWATICVLIMRTTKCHLPMVQKAIVGSQLIFGNCPKMADPHHTKWLFPRWRTLNTQNVFPKWRTPTSQNGGSNLEPKESAPTPSHRHHSPPCQRLNKYAVSRARRRSRHGALLGMPLVLLPHRTSGRRSLRITK